MCFLFKSEANKIVKIFEILFDLNIASLLDCFSVRRDCEFLPFSTDLLPCLPEENVLQIPLVSLKGCCENVRDSGT